MSQSYREQRPLLCEDVSEEERFTEYPRRLRGRAKNIAKGATAIITRWPDHWSCFTYWWIGISIMALMFFAMYNIIIASVLLPTIQMKPVRTSTFNENVSHLPEIFMHVFVDSDEEGAISKYLPYVQIMSDKYLDYNFNLIVLVNDTTKEIISPSAEENNENALNSLWSTENSYKPKLNMPKNIKIRQVSLSKYLKDIPTQHDWKKLPPQFIPFLVKAFSIWNEGGIAINPEILTPHSPSTIYIEKFQSLLKIFKKVGVKVSNESRLSTKHEINHTKILKKKVNNIHDIIEMLEHEDDNKTQENLTEAENAVNPVVSLTGRKLLSIAAPTQRNKTNITEVQHSLLNPSINISDHNSKLRIQDETNSFQILDDGFVLSDEYSEPKYNAFLPLPLFWEFIFQDKSVPLSKKGDEGSNPIRRRKSVTSIPQDKSKKISSTPLPTSLNEMEIKANKKYKPMIIPAKNKIGFKNYLKSNNTKIVDVGHEDHVLTIDLKGNMLATRAPCHAFIGTVFSNIYHHQHHYEETLQDLIIDELSLFCKGLLSTCQGIDVILL